MNKKTVVLLLASALAVMLSACGMIGISTEGGQITIDVNLNEEQVNNLIERSFTANGTSSDFLLSSVSSIDLIEPNTIRVFGESDGVEGSYDITMEAVDGALRVAVVAVNMPGVTMDDPRIAKANEDMAQSFLDQVQSPDAGQFTNVSVVDGELRFSFEAPLSQ